MQQPGLHGRHRDRNGEISRKHGNTRVETLRKIYGPSFAVAFPATAQLREVLETLDEESLTRLVHDHDGGHLDGKIQQHS